jgi:hypothetical protein
MANMLPFFACECVQCEDAKRHYDHEVVQHGDALKRYATLDTAHSALQQRLTGIIQQLDEARVAKVRLPAIDVCTPVKTSTICCQPSSQTFRHCQQ